MARAVYSVATAALVALSLFSVVHAAPSAISAIPTDWVFKGCYIDNVADRSLQGASTSGDDMTIESCITFCAGQGFNLAGTEFGAECYCDFVINVSQEPAGDCNMACAGDASETCGAANRLTVYQYDGTAPLGPLVNPGPAGWTSLGCYCDNVSARTLSTNVQISGGPSAMTVAHCTSACQAGGFKLAGVEFGDECWCDNQLENGAEPESSGCVMACEGNTTEACGGSDRINIYEFGAITIATAPGPGGSSSGSSTSSSAINPPTTSNPATSTTASTTASSSVPSNLPPNWEYRGCFIDPTNARIFSHEEPDNSDLTVESCVSTCVNLGFSVAGMEFGVQCFCDNFVRNGGNQTVDSDCNMACSGNAAEICGAGNRMSVYSNATLEIFQPPTAQTTGLPGDWKYVGCISDDSTGNRTLPWQIIFPSNNSAATCLTQCSDFGYTAGGMEFGDECYCGDPADVAAVGATTEPETDCNMVCVGDPTAICGAGNRLSYYEWQGSILTQFSFPQGTAAGLYEFFIGGLVVPLVSAQTINKKVEFLEKFGETANSTGAYELDVSLVDDFNAAWRTLHVATDVFCTAMIQLPDRVGRLLSVGGWSASALVGVRLLWPTGSLGVPSTRDWQENVQEVHLLDTRWYPSAVVMANGSILVIGGENGSNGPPVPTMEILPPPTGGFSKFAEWLNRTDPNNLYPFVCVLPSGGIFVQYYNEALILDENTLDVVKQLPNVPGAVNDPAAGRNYPLEGTMVLMPQSAPYTDPLTVMVCGGGTQPGTGPGIDNCVSLQPEVDGAQWVLERMPSKRVMSCMTALPDGTYLITNGAGIGAAGFGLATDPNTNAVLYDPTKPLGQRFSVMANSTLARLYHSESILLSDGSVLVSGSDPEDPRFPQEYRVEKFLPPYLTNPKPRPTFTISNIDWAYGASIAISNVAVHNAPLSEVKITIMAAEASTHGNSFGQRMLFPAFSCSGTTCTVTAPPNAHVWPPAWAQVFLVDGGMPSESQYVRIGGDPAGLGNWPDAAGFDVPGTGPAQVGGNTTVNS